MKLRKEQVLCLLAVALAALLFVTGGSDGPQSKKVKAKTKKYDSITLPVDALAAADAARKIADQRDVFRRPSRTQPLPPLDWPELELPRLATLPLLEPPLSHGPLLSHWHLLRLDREAFAVQLTDPTSLNSSADAASSSSDQEVADSSTTGQGDGQDQGEDWSRSWDRVDTTDGRSYWGRVLGKDPLALGTASSEFPMSVVPAFGGQVLLRRVDPEKGRVIAPRWPFRPEDIKKITFANNIRNRIGMRRRRIPPGDAGLRDRERYMRELVTVERQHPEALDEAEIQAKEYIQAAPNSGRGYELEAFVYSATGQLEKETALYDRLAQGPFKGAAFVRRGRGVLASRLGLHEDAERFLREAVSIDQTDPSNHLALSRFLYGRGRGKEALASARSARQLVVPGMDPAFDLAIRKHLLSCLLGVGDAQAAQNALNDAKGIGNDPELILLEACTTYARGDREAAFGLFTSAATVLPDSATARIGVGLCAFHAKQYDTAMAAFRQAEQRDPLERHRAIAAQAFVLLLTKGRTAEAIARAEEARTIAPDDPYVLYLLGCAFHVAGDYERASQNLDACLRDHFDFVDAMAELARTKLDAGLEGGSDALLSFETAERLCSRAVAEGHKHGKLWKHPYLLGVIRYHLGKARNVAARQAFELARKWGNKIEVPIWLALIRNRQGHSDEAITKLRQIWQGIREPDHPLKIYADKTRKILAQHQGKRVFSDGFVGIGKHWQVQQNGQRRISWRSIDDVLVCKGPSRLRAATVLRYKLDPSKSFVEVSVDLERGQANTTPVALRITTPSGRSNQNSSFELKVGLAGGTDDRECMLYLRDGRNETKKNTTRIYGRDEPKLKLAPGQRVRIHVSYELPVGARSNQGVLTVRWGGNVILRKSGVRWPTTNTWFNIDLHVDGDEGGEVDFKFDNFRLVRFGN